MPKPKPLTDSHGEVREILQADLQHFKPAAHALPAGLRRKLGVRGPEEEPTNKSRDNIRPAAADEERAMGEFRTLLAQRLAQAGRGEVSNQTITDIAEAAMRAGSAA